MAALAESTLQGSSLPNPLAWLMPEYASPSRRTKLKLCARTWNVGDTPPPEAEGVTAWLRWSGAANGEEGGSGIRGGDGTAASGDVYAIGLQEVVNISSLSAYTNNALYMALGETTSNGLSDGVVDQVLLWQHALADALPGCSLVARKVLVGMTLFVFVRLEHLPFCAVRVSAFGTGPLGAGNKGAVAASIHLYGSTLCLVSPHLASGSNAAMTRNAEVAQLLSLLRFPAEYEASPAPPATIGGHEFVVWLGDMNYRIRMTDEGVRRAMEAYPPPVAELAAADELLLERLAGRVFVGFKEGPLTFHPTYKYDRGTDMYDTSRKKRAPAWCDRVLWRESEDVRQLCYGRVERLMNSDHRPVAADFELSIASSSVASRPQPPTPAAAAADGIRTVSVWGACLSCVAGCLQVPAGHSPSPAYVAYARSSTG